MYVGGVVGMGIPTGNAATVYIDSTSAQLGTVLVNANGENATRPARRGAQHQAMLNDKVEKLQATVAQQQKQIEALTAGLQKVSAQLELSKLVPQTIATKQ